MPVVINVCVSIYFYFDSLRLNYAKTIVLEVKALILHPCIETRVSGRCLSRSQVTAGSSVRRAVS